MQIRDGLVKEGAVVEIIAPRLGTIISEKNAEIPVDKSLLTAASVLYDAVYVPGGSNSVATIAAEPDAVHFLNEVFKHCKAIAAFSSARDVLDATYFSKKVPKNDSDDSTALTEGIIIHTSVAQLLSQFIAAVTQHRFWEREKPRKVPA
jgi:catalase